MPRTACKQYLKAFKLLLQTEMDSEMHTSSLLAAVPAPIWLDIFATVQTLTGELRTPAQYIQYHMLRLVCKHFNSLFAQHSELSRHILLRPNYPSSCLPSLLGHLHRCGESTLTIDLMCTDADVLSCVLQQRLQLEARNLQVVSQATVALLSGLCFLQRCELTSSKMKICLEPMSGLPALEGLKLSGGEFTGLQSFAHLTSLEVVQATAYASGVDKCLFSSKLQTLSVKNGILLNLDVKGLSGCRKLQVLTIHGLSYVAPESADNTLLILSYCHIPPSISKLSALTELALDIRPSADPANLPWLYKLTALQSLQLQLFGGVSMYIGLKLAALSKLRTIYVSLNGERSGECRLFINVEWELMHTLQQDTFKRRVGLFCFLSTICNLENAPNLQSLSLCQWKMTHPDPRKVQLFDCVVQGLI